ERATRAEQVTRERGDDDREDDDGRREGALVRERAGERVVREPAEDQDRHARGDELPALKARARGIQQVLRGIDVIEEDEQREAAEPRRVRLPLEPRERRGKRARGEAA